MKKKFAKTLEEKAGELAAYPDRKHWDDSIPSMVSREIALTVEQIQRLRQQHDEQFRRLLKVECYIDTDLMQMAQHQPRSLPFNFPQEEKLKQRLFEIETTRHNIQTRLEKETQGLESKLLELLNRHNSIGD